MPLYQRSPIARSHLTMLENGKKTARLDTAFRLACALEIKPSELIRMVEEECLRGQAKDEQGRP